MPAAVPYCPRCGYDQRGLVDAWTTQCPLDGRCSECGLDFHWCDVFNPERTAPPLIFERTNRRFIRAFFVTFFRTLFPPLLWRKLEMIHPVRPLRLAVYVFLGVVAYQAAILSAALLANFSLRYLWHLYDRLVSGDVFNDVYRFVRDNAFPYDDVGVNNYWWYGTKMPLQSLGIIIGVVVLSPVGVLILRQTLKRYRVRAHHILRCAALGFVGVAGIVGLCLMLPGVFEFLCDVIGFSRWGGTFPYAVSDYLSRGWIANILVPLWLWWYWCSAIGTYLKLPHAGAVSLAALAIAAGLTLLVGLLLMGPMLLYHFI